MDVITYVQGDLSKEIDMNQPELFSVKGQKDKVCMLKQPLYGLRQSSHEWYKKLDGLFIKLIKFIKMKKTEQDPST